MLTCLHSEGTTKTTSNIFQLLVVQIFCFFTVLLTGSSSESYAAVFLTFIKILNCFCRARGLYRKVGKRLVYRSDRTAIVIFADSDLHTDPVRRMVYKPDIHMFA